jgi:hypothetical protein
VFVPINPNTASDETLLSVPGLTLQLLKALKDHRPCKSVQEFRTEIGKHVNANELSRLEVISRSAEDELVLQSTPFLSSVRAGHEYDAWVKPDRHRRVLSSKPRRWSVKEFR